MTREEEILNKAINYSEIEDNFIEYDDCGDVCDDKDFIEKAFIEGAEWADRTMIEKACRCYCDDICDKGRCCMCFHKHDGKGQVKNNFQYNECNELKLIRKAMEE
jgi:hypothetical protein